MVSKREQDLKRRQGNKRSPRALYALGAIGVAVILVVLMAGRNAATGLDAFELDDDPFMGSEDAKLILIGYESPHCSACQNFHVNILPQLEQYFDNGSLVYYYVQGTIMDSDRQSSLAQECAYRHGGNSAFWSFTDRLYSRPGSSVYGTPDLAAWLSDLAKQNDLDESLLQKCFREQETSKNVSEDWRVGRDNDIRGTPTFWISDGSQPRLVSSVNEIPNIVAAMLK